MKILSIDFDYFQKVTKRHLLEYPDGIDTPTLMSEIIWASHYATAGDILNEITLLKEEYNYLVGLLQSQPSDIPVMITNSHVKIYDFINNHILPDERLNIVNIDFHHDIINENEHLDCGNWIGYIINKRKEENKKTKFTWIPNPISLEIFGIENLFKENNLESTICNSISDISDKIFDAVFLCRSDAWTVPHLDIHFSELCQIINEHYSNVDIEKFIHKPRTAYKDFATQISDVTNKIKHD